MLPVGPDGTLANRVFLDDPRVSRLLEVLSVDGDEARVVGGAVRNALLDLPLGDIDVATSALPEIVMHRAKAARLRVVPTGVAHGTVTVIVQGLAIEVTTLREDVETDGRHAVVRFGRDFADDARRRDFTINALSVDRHATIFDYTDGITDLAAGRVRFIGDAPTRIREDYLRVLRFFRFSASYATGPIDEQGLAAAAASVQSLARLSRERVRTELLKLLAASRAADVLPAMKGSGVLSAVLGERVWPDRFARLKRIERSRGARPDPILSLAALALKLPSDASGLRDALRLSNEERDRLMLMAAQAATQAGRRNAPGAQEIAALLFTVGRRACEDVIALWHLDSGAPPDAPDWMAAARAAGAAPVPTLSLSGADVVAKGVRKGPAVGQILKILQARWIGEGFPSSPATLQRLLDEAIDAAGSEPA